MKSTGEAIGYDDKLTRALYKALQATGMNVCNYGTIFVTIADHDKEQAPAPRAAFLRPRLQRRGDDRAPPNSCANTASAPARGAS
ncbi:MAG: hypothetical protein ACLUFW_10805 [Alistipes sp.]